eukprot:422642-Pelagomonas_calceolata.AAC.2
MLPELYKLQDEMPHIKIVKFNCNKQNKDLGKALNIRVAPTFHLYRNSQKGLCPAMFQHGDRPSPTSPASFQHAYGAQAMFQCLLPSPLSCSSTNNTSDDTHTCCMSQQPNFKSCSLQFRSLQVGEMTGAKIDKLRNLIESALGDD